MRKFKNRLRSTAYLAMVLAAIALASPVLLQGQGGSPTRDVNIVNTAENPVLVSVQNGNGDQKVLITLVDDVAIPAGGLEFGPVDVGDFNFVSFLGRNLGGRNAQVTFFFGAEEVPLDFTVNRVDAGSCLITPSRGVHACVSSGPANRVPVAPFLVQRISGPFLTVKIQNDGGGQPLALVTLKAYLTK